MSMSVSQLAATAGVSPDTVRYYERVGLLPAPERTASGYRRYEPAHADRLRFIRGAQGTGLRLRDVAELLAVMDRGLCPFGHTEDTVRRRVAAMDAEIRGLRALKRRLVQLLEAVSVGEARSAGRWTCEDAFIRVGGGEPNGRT